MALLLMCLVAFIGLNIVLGIDANLEVAGLPIQIPKLSSNPTIAQLISDWSVAQEMVAVDMRISDNTPVAGKTAIGFDDVNVDFVVDHVTQTQTAPIEHMSIDVDRTPPGGPSWDNDTFGVEYAWQQSGNLKLATIYLGKVSGSSEPPSGFKWDMAFAKSYFNQNQTHVIFVAQIPKSYFGPGGAGGTYGIYTVIWITNQYPSYPPSGNAAQPQRWGIFTTQYPIPEFSQFQGVVAAVALIASLSSIAYAKRHTT